MFGAEILDLVIGLSYVYFILSIVCVGINEMIASALGLRARTLRTGILGLLGGNEKLLKEFCKHPLIESLSKGDWAESNGEGPSYIPADIFRKVLFSLTPCDQSSHTDVMTAASLREMVDRIPEPQLKRALQTILNDATLTVYQANQKIEQWFDQSMQRVSGWYKRRVSLIVFIVSVLVVLASNADTIRIATALNQDNAMEAAVAAAAEASVSGNPMKPPSTGDEVIQTFEKAQDLGLPLGWSGEVLPSERPSVAGPAGRLVATKWWVSKIAGLVFTIIAISLGAPFWFDTMQKLVSLRSSGGKPAKES